jgi:uncharacterized protein (DUF2062 family)
MKRIFSTFRHHLGKLMRLQDDPDRIANGYALGIFLATTPLIGMKVFIALGITWLCKWNKAAAIVGVYHVNSLTAPLFYGFTYYIGSRLTGSDPSLSISQSFNYEALVHQSGQLAGIIAALVVGGLVTGIPAAWLAKKLMKNMILQKRNI